MYEGSDMSESISCPACKVAITPKQLFWTATLMSFRCPHCRVRVRPENLWFAKWWLVVGALVGALLGFSAAKLPVLVGERADPDAVFLGVVIIGFVAVAVIKWRASLTLIRNGELRGPR